MKSSKAEIRAGFHKIPRLRFTAERTLTSYAGLVLVQALIAKLKLKARLSACLATVRKHAIYGPASIVMLVVVMIMLGCRRLRDLDYCREEPMLAGSPDFADSRMKNRAPGYGRGQEQALRRRSIHGLSNLWKLLRLQLN